MSSFWLVTYFAATTTAYEMLSLCLEMQKIDSQQSLSMENPKLSFYFNKWHHLGEHSNM
jgi:hypothetical protein